MEEIHPAKIGDVQIEIAIVVEVGPTAAGGIPAASHDRSAGDACKIAVAEIAIKRVVAIQAGEKEIVVAIVVVIAPGAGREATGTGQFAGGGLDEEVAFLDLEHGDLLVGSDAGEYRLAAARPLHDE